MEKFSSNSQKLLPWLILVIRIFLFGFIQALIAVVLWASGWTASFSESAKWWPISVVLANLICIFLMVRLFGREGIGYWDIFHIKKETVKNDIVAILLILLVLGPVGFFPNLLLAKWLFGDNLTALGMYIHPLPLWATLVAVVIFPLSQGLAELPTYFAYVMPRLERQVSIPWLAMALSAIFLAAQHICAPLILDYRFILWRLLMFMPFAFGVGIVLHWRPRLLPYLVIIHILMDLSLAPFFLGVL